MNYVNRKRKFILRMCNVVSLLIFAQIAIRAPPFDYWIHGKTVSADVM